VSDKKLKLGIFGFGCVGQGLYHTLNETSGIKAEIIKICVKDRAKFRPFPDESYFTFDLDEILNNDEINVVVELIDDSDVAYSIVKKALQKGKAVVTANKKLIAEHLEELILLSKEYNSPLLYEASCCASIPVIRNLEEYYDNDLLSSIGGIFNGSSNYILTKILEEQLDYSTALLEAQEKGFAETDPSFDVKGWDARYKLSIIITHAYGLFIESAKILCFGIDQISEGDIQYANEKNLSIKLKACSQKIGDKIVAYVAPFYVKKENPLSTVNYEFNAVEIEGAFSERQLFIGKGAGSYPTGSAVLSDISALSYDYKYEYKKLTQKLKIEHSEDYCVRVYVGFKNESDVGFSDFEEISETYLGAERNFIVGTIMLQKLKESHWQNNKCISVIFIDGVGEFVKSNAQDILLESVG